MEIVERRERRKGKRNKEERREKESEGLSREPGGKKGQQRGRILGVYLVYMKEGCERRRSFEIPHNV